MTAIKSFTDLSQSKTLSTILPLESADMKILPFTEREYRIVPINDISVCGREDEIYAWSLSALFNVLPNKICFDNETYYLNCNKEEVKYLGPVTCDGQKGIVSASNNLLDSCYKMIRTLHELKLL